MSCSWKFISLWTGWGTCLSLCRSGKVNSEKWWRDNGRSDKRRSAEWIKGRNICQIKLTNMLRKRQFVGRVFVVGHQVIFWWVIAQTLIGPVFLLFTKIPGSSQWALDPGEMFQLGKYSWWLSLLNFEGAHCWWGVLQGNFGSAAKKGERLRV